MTITVLIAGTNDPSNAAALAEAFIRGIKSVKDMHIETVFLRDLSLEHFTLAHYEPKTDQGKDFLHLQTLITQSVGLVIATPIWNFSVPAHLKNLIDRMGSFALDESHSLGTLKGKPVYLLYTGGSPAVAWKALIKKTVSHMPVSLRYFGAAVIGSHYEERCTLGRGKFGLILNQRPARLENAAAKGKHFAEVVAYREKTGKLPTKERFLQWFVRFAQTVKKKLGL